MSIPLPLPPGRGGFGPTLALQYSSGGGNGPYGIGWSLDAPAITRKTDKGLPRYLDDDRLSDTFILSGAEDLVPLLVETPAESGNWEHPVAVVEGERRERFRPRVEGDFARIERVLRSGAKGQSGYYWQASTKDNVRSTFGWDESARIMRPGQPHIIFSWLLEETRDDRGNVIRYEYKAEDLDGVPRWAAEAHRHDGRSAVTANRYLKRILYGNKAGVANPTSPADFHFEIVFDYGEHDEEEPTPTDAGTWAVRQDAFSSYRAGFELRTYRLCRRVLVFHRFEGLAENAPPVLVRSLDLEYEQSPAVTYLKRATQKGYRAPRRATTPRRCRPSPSTTAARPSRRSCASSIAKAKPASPTAWTAAPISSWISTVRASRACSPKKPARSPTSETSARASSPGRARSRANRRPRG
jgi:hypothetical protein